MDLLVIDPIDADVMRWLGSRHQLRFAPELAFAPRDFRRALYNVRAVIVPASVGIDAETLDFAPVLRAVGRVSAGSENIDLEACEKRKVEVVRSLTASARAEAEFVVGAMLALFRRVPVRASDGSIAGRELGGATIGLVGMPPAARMIVQLLAGFGVRILGYDPALHARDPSWAHWQVAHAGLRDLVERADVLCVQLDYFSRYHGLLGERFLRAQQDQPGGREHGAFGSVRRACAGDGTEERPDRRRLARQRRAWRPRPAPPAARHRDAAGDAAGRGNDARVASAQRLGGGAPDRRDCCSRRRRPCRASSP